MILVKTIVTLFLMLCIGQHFLAGQTTTSSATVTISLDTLSGNKQITTASTEKFKATEIRQTRKHFYFFLSGFCFLMVISQFFKSVINQNDKANFYCSIMFLASLINVLCWSGVIKINIGFINSGVLGLWFNQLVPILLILLYREFLDLTTSDTNLYRILKFLAYGLFTLNLGLFIDSSQKLSLLSFEKLYEYVLLFTLVFMVIKFMKYKNHAIYKYASWSSWIIVVTFTIYLLLKTSNVKFLFSEWFIPGFLMYFALMADGILFLVALSTRDEQIRIDKILLEKQGTQNELKILRSQMNPHFLFNSLNSIKSFTLNNDSENANTYLTKFSKLIRQVLDNSREEKISIKNEIETLTLYLEMEKLRVGDKFSYVIHISDDLEPELIEIQPMMIQPYAENAIWHGIMNKEGNGHLVIDLKISAQNTLIVTIEDDGIGRKAAYLLKPKDRDQHKSVGMQITSDRIEKLQLLHQTIAKSRTIDLFDSNGVASGTKVVLELSL